MELASCATCGWSNESEPLIHTIGELGSFRVSDLLESRLRSRRETGPRLLPVERAAAPRARRAVSRKGNRMPKPKSRCAGETEPAAVEGHNIAEYPQPDYGIWPGHTAEKNSCRGDTSSKKRSENRCR